MKLDEIRPQMFEASVHFNHVGPSPLEYLTSEQRERMFVKLRMVEDLACRLAASQLKGTLKYETDDRSRVDWLERAVEDMGDGLLYGMWGLYKAREDENAKLGS